MCTVAEFYDRMRKVQLERRAEAKKEARRKEIAARKMISPEQLEHMAATKARVENYNRIATKAKRSAAADAALGRIIDFLDENKLMMADLFNLLDLDSSGEFDGATLLCAPAPGQFLSRFVKLNLIWVHAYCECKRPSCMVACSDSECD